MAASASYEEIPNRDEMSSPRLSAAWIARLARSLQTIAGNLGQKLAYTSGRELSAKAIGFSGDHEVQQRIVRGTMPVHKFDHELPRIERDRRKDRQTGLLRLLFGDDDLAEAAWLAWRPTANLREEALIRWPATGSMVSLSDIMSSPGARMDPTFHLHAQHIARAHGWTWKEPTSKARAMRLAHMMEQAGVPLDRPYPDQLHPTRLGSEDIARTYLAATGFEQISRSLFARKLAPRRQLWSDPAADPDFGPRKEALLKLYAGLKGGEVTYRVSTDTLEEPADS